MKKKTKPSETSLAELFGIWAVMMILVGITIEILFHPTPDQYPIAKLAQVLLGFILANIATYNLERKRNG